MAKLLDERPTGGTFAERYNTQTRTRSRSVRQRESDSAAQRPAAPESWILGARYVMDESGQKDFSLHAQSCLRFTYRRNFPALAPYQVTSDAGWGCMIRAAQMLMGNALRVHLLGAQWRMRSVESLQQDPDYRKVLRWFLDHPGPNHVFSIHHMVQCGMKYDMLPGEWWGPTTACYVLRDLCKVHRINYGGPLAVYVTQSEDIYITDVEQLCSNLSLNDCLLGLTENQSLSRPIRRVNSKIEQRMKSKSKSHVDLAAQAAQSALPSQEKGWDPTAPTMGAERLSSECAVDKVEAFFDPLFRQPPSQVSPWTCGLLLLVPLRLGVNTVNKEYHEAIKEVFRQPWCVGMVGGRIGHAIYFTGYDSARDVLYGLDPHTVFATESDVDDGQSPASSAFPREEMAAQVHVSSFVTLPLTQLDPSIAVGFRFKDREDFDAFCRHYHNNKGLVNIQHRAPTYMLEDTDFPDDEDVPHWMRDFIENARNQGKMRDGLASSAKLPSHAADESDDDEWEFL